jgi:hypothetical protein
MNAKTFGLAGLWAVTVIIAAVAIAKLNQTRALNQQLRAELETPNAMDAREPRSSEENPVRPGLARDEKLELMRLRNEVTQLRASAAAAREAVKDALENRDEAMRRVALVDRNGREIAESDLNTADLSFRGYATAEDAFTSAVAAMKDGDAQTMVNSMTPEEAARWQSLNAGKSEEEIKARFVKEFGSNSTLRIKGAEHVSPTEIVLEVELERPMTKRVRMNLVGNEWKAGAPINQNKQVAGNQGGVASEQAGDYDPMAFYKKNPELMKRYFPHLYQQQQGAEGGAGTLPPEPAPQP